MQDRIPSPLILAFVSEAALQAALETAAAEAGFALRLVGSAEEIIPTHLEDKVHDPGEPIGGRQGALFEFVVDLQPALLCFDLENTAIPWRRWIPTLKSSPATRRIPIIATAAEESDAIGVARGCGAERVLARSRFLAALPRLIERYARVGDAAALAAACAEPLSELAKKGLALFNQGQYFEAHEELEHAWNGDDGPGRELYRAILQVGVAYLQIERGNFKGAHKMLLRVRQWLDPLPARCRGVDVAQLRRDAQAVHEALRQIGPEDITEFDRSLFKPIFWIDQT